MPRLNGSGSGIKHPLAPGGESTLDLEVLDAAAPDLEAIDVYETEAERRRHAQGAYRSAAEPRLQAAGDLGVAGSVRGRREPGRSAPRACGRSRARWRWPPRAGSRSWRRAATRAPPTASASTRADRPARGQLPGLVAVGDRRRRHQPGAQRRQSDHAQFVWNDTLAAAGRSRRRRLQRAVHAARPTRRDGQANRRAVPDVSMLADIVPGYACICSAAATASPTPARTRGRRSAAPARRRRCWPAGLRSSTSNCGSTAAPTSASSTRCSTSSATTRRSRRQRVRRRATVRQRRRPVHPRWSLAAGCCTARPGLRRRLGLGQRQPRRASPSRGRADSPRRRIASLSLRPPAPLLKRRRSLAHGLVHRGPAALAAFAPGSRSVARSRSRSLEELVHIAALPARPCRSLRGKSRSAQAAARGSHSRAVATTARCRVAVSRRRLARTPATHVRTRRSLGPDAARSASRLLAKLPLEFARSWRVII